MIDDSFWQERAGRAGRYATGYEGFDPRFAEALAALVRDWERQTGRRADFTSFGRTPEQGREIWERSGHGKRFLAAAPGKSRHEYDLAAGRYATAADIPRGDFLDYAHENAGKYGLEFLSGSAFARDPVHIQLSRGGPGGGPSGSPGPSFGGYATEDPYASSIRSLMGLPARQEESSDSGGPFDTSILRALAGGPLVIVNDGGGGGGGGGYQDFSFLNGGGGSDSQIGSAYADSLDTGGDVPLVVSKTLSSRGWAPDEIAAAIGNAYGESSFRPGVSGDGGNASGLWQWAGQRKTGLLNYASQTGRPWTDPAVQAEYLDAERTGESTKYGGVDESSSYAKAFAVDGPVGKTIGFTDHVERASIPSHKRRVDAALSWFNDAATKYGDETGMFTQMSYTPTPEARTKDDAVSGVRSWSESAFPAFDTSPQWSVAGFPESGPPAASAVPDPRVKPSPSVDPVTTASTAPAEPEMPYWNEPDFNELQGGSKHAYHFDPATGRGVYKTSKGKLIAYDESGASSPIGERNVDAFVTRNVPRAESGGGRRISGSSTLGAASRDPVARALADSVRPWPKAEHSPIRILSKFGLDERGGPPPTVPRTAEEIIPLLGQIKKNNSLLDYTYALKNYAELLDTTPEILDKSVEQAAFAGWEPGTPGEGGGGGPKVTADQVVAKLLTMSETDPAYYETLHAGSAVSGVPEPDLKAVVEARRKAAGAVPTAIDWTIDWSKNADKIALALGNVMAVTHLDGMLKTHPSYAAARAETIRQAGLIGIPAEIAEQELAKRGF